MIFGLPVSVEGSTVVFGSVVAAEVSAVLCVFVSVSVLTVTVEELTVVVASFVAVAVPPVPSVVVSVLPPSGLQQVMSTMLYANNVITTPKASFRISVIAMVVLFERLNIYPLQNIKDY